MGQALFLVVALAIVGLIHYYLWRRLIRNTTVEGRWRRAGTWTFIGLAALLILTLIGSRLLPHSVAAALSWPGYLWLAVMFYLVVVLVVLELPAFVARRVLPRRSAQAQRPLADATVHSGRSTGTRSTIAMSMTADTVTDDARPVEVPAKGEAQTSGGSGDDRPPPGPQTGGDDRPPPGPQTGGDEEGNVRSRRLFLARAVAITAGLASVGVVASGVRSAIGPPQLKRVQIPLAKLPRSADGYRIALVADIHLGPLRGYSHTRRIVDIINGLDANIVSVVGDLVDGTVAELGAAAAPLRDLRSRNGAYFVTGNHEYYSGYTEWIDEVATLGVRPLRNEWLELPGGLDLSGVNDVTGESFSDGPDFDNALKGRDTSRPVVLLAHQPIQAYDAAKHGVDLQLSGHTHGGQLVPFNLVVRLAQQPVVSGLGHVDGMPVYVTNGAGFWGPPVRVGAPPDITLVELRSV